MVNNNPSTNKEFLEVISLGVKHLDVCIELDNLALNGLWNRDQWKKELEESQRLCLGILDESKLIAIACGWLVVDELQLTAIAVHPEHRRKGLARQVLLMLLLKASGQGKIRATLEVARDNSSALALYKSFGFQTTGCRKSYYRNGSAAIFQWRCLKCLQQNFSRT